MVGGAHGFSTGGHEVISGILQNTHSTAWSLYSSFSIVFIMLLFLPLMKYALFSSGLW